MGWVFFLVEGYIRGSGSETVVKPYSIDLNGQINESIGGWHFSEPL